MICSPHVPFIEACEQARLHYVVVAKPDSHQELWEWAEELEAMKESEHVQWSVGPACMRQRYEARIVRRRRAAAGADGEVRVNFVEAVGEQQNGQANLSQLMGNGLGSDCQECG
ncbi:MAG: hypothetical protein WKF84_18120 [Pyrinomonadaceae bacterium]